MMKGLLIKDKTHWCDRWSAEIATTLSILDASYDLIIFDRSHDLEDIKAVIADAPENIYQIVELEQAGEDIYDFMADSGLCYRKVG
jgi:hypothetical protein